MFHMDGAAFPYFGVDKTFIKIILSESRILQKLFLAYCLPFQKVISYADSSITNG